MRSITVGIAVLSIVLILAPIFSLVNALTVENFLVDSGENETLTINLQAKQTVTGSFSITGLGSALAPNTIDFWVRDLNGVIILNSSTVSDGENFTFTASSEGEYILNFLNDFGYRMHIDLEFSASSPPILGFDLIVFSVIIVVIGVVLAIVGFAVYRNRAKRRIVQLPPQRALRVYPYCSAFD
jgi:hypothetical protein